MAMDPKKQLGGPPDNVNEALFDAMIRHQIFLLRMSGSVRNRVIDILNATEADIAERIRARLGTRGSSLLGTRRLQLLHQAVRNLRLEAWDQINELWVEEMIALAQSEAAVVDSAIKTVAPVVLDTVLPSAELLRRVATQNPFDGKVLGEWAKDIRDADLERIRRAINIGVVQGETGSQIARRVVGTGSLRGLDGRTQVTRRQVDGLTRTAVNAMANMSRAEYFRANSSLIEEELYVATLDGRTTPQCRKEDGERYPVGVGPMPPLHFGCRSLRVALLTADALGDRPFKATTEKMLVREYTRGRVGLEGITRRADLPRGTKGPFDQFARERVRQMIGRVEAKVTYQEWLGRQSAEFQDDVLGKTRGRLFRRGGLTLDKFVNRQGDEIPLDQLAQREKRAFEAAGL